jgi:secreted trypsin-like serine protease
MRRGYFALCTAVIILVSGCGRGSSPANSRVDIVRGSDAAGFAQLHTVGISWSDDASVQRPYCSGTLISRSPNLVLTAAHCAQQGTSGSPQQGEPGFVYFSEGVLRKVVRVAARADWFLSNADVAVLEFEGTIPNSFEPIQIVDSEDLLQKDLDANMDSGTGLSKKEFLIAGWGRLSTNGSAPEKLQATTVKLWKFWRSGFGLGLLAFESEEKRGACYGDSGGPAYYEIDGKWLLVGVTHGSNSLFLRDLPVDIQGNCDVGKSLYTSAARFEGWILKEFPNAKLDGLAGPADSWSGKEKASTFLEACRLGESLEKKQWESVLEVLLEVGTGDCVNADKQVRERGLSISL